MSTASGSSTQQMLALKRALGGGPGTVTGNISLLSLDGGGVKGWSSLKILELLMTKVNAVREDRGEKPVKPCEIFDLIGGTSTGGLIAIMLGRLQMDVGECLAHFENLMKSVFEDKEHLIAISWRGKVQNRLNPAKLKAAVIEVLRSKQIPETEMFDDEKERPCRTLVVARRFASANEVAITDYTVRGSQNYDKMTIVEAALATSAASTFFPPLEMDGRKYIDGALGSNNPINIIWNSAHAIWSPEQDLTPKVLSVVSIGTGKGAFTAVESNAYKFLTETLISIVSETEQTHRIFENGHPAMIPRKGSRQYYRWNVEQGMEKVGLEEYKKKNLIEDATAEYLTLSHERNNLFRDCAEGLAGKESDEANRLSEFLPALITHNDTDLECEDCIRSLRQPRTDPTGKGLHMPTKDPAANRLWGQKWREDYEEPSAGTLKWLLDEDQDEDGFKPWWDSDSGMFWIQGNPGSGKSFLMKHLIRKHEKTHGDNEITVGFFFSKMGTYLERSMEGLLRVLLAKILQKRKTLFHCIREFYNTEINDPSYPVDWKLGSLRQALSLVFESTECLTKVTLFVDAVDECTGRSGEKEDSFLSCMRPFIKNMPEWSVRLKVCFSSRTFDKLPQHELKDIPGFFLEDKTVDDLSQFVSDKFLSSPLELKDGVVQEELLEIFSRKAGGCWLWVEWAVRILMEDGQSVAEVKKRLEDIPSRLFDLYDDFMKSIDPTKIETVNKILAITSSSRYYLYLDDIRYVLGFTSGQKFVSHEEMEKTDTFIRTNRTMASRIKQLCGPLIAVKAADGAGDDNGLVRLFHSTVVDYLSEKGTTSGPTLSPLSLTSLGDELLSRSCLAVLSSKEVQKLVLEIQAAPNIDGQRSLWRASQQRLPLILYAVANVFSHHLSTVAENPETVKEFEAYWSVHFSDWKALYETFMIMNSTETTLAQVAASIHFISARQYSLPVIVALEGSAFYLERLIQNKSVDPNARLPNGSHFLGLAAFLGFKDMVEMLLSLEEPKVDIDAVGGTLCNALQAAALAGHTEIVKLLLDKGANPFITGGKYKSPLCAASFGLHDDIVDLLLTHPRTKPVFDNSQQQLKAVAFMGHRLQASYKDRSVRQFGHDENRRLLRMMNLLGRAGIKYAVLNVQAAILPLIVWFAQRPSFTEVLDILTQDPRALDFQKNSDFCLFHVLCAWSVASVIEQIINRHRFFLGLRDEKRRTALHYAAANDSPDVLSYLLRLDKLQTKAVMDPSLHDKFGLTPLHIAFGHGTLKHIENLEAAGATYPMHNPNGLTLLHFAVLNVVHPEVLDKLDMTQLNIHARDDSGRTPLHLASHYSHIDAVNFLLSLLSNTALNDLDSAGRSAIHHAAMNQTSHAPAILTRLHSAAPDLSLSAPDTTGSTPMHLVFHDPKQASRYLFWPDFFTTPFDAFDSNQTSRTAQFLLRMLSGPDDVRVADEKGNTPLHLACWRQLPLTATLLLAAGADADAVDGQGKVPLERMRILDEGLLMRIHQRGESGRFDGGGEDGEGRGGRVVGRVQEVLEEGKGG